MTDDNAPARRHLRAAREHLKRMQAQREAIQALAAQHLAGQAPPAVDSPPTPPTEGAP